MVIQVKDLAKSYGDLQVITDFNLEFSPGLIHCIFGPSGCGKTTLINTITGLAPADRGQIEGIGDKTCSYIFQEDRLLPWATVEENLFFVLKNGRAASDANQLVEKYLDLVNLKQFKDALPHELSGGMKQRVAIARAFAYGGDLLVMDEPFKGLDFELKRGLMDYLINFWHQQHRYFIFITHDLEEAMYLADRVHVFTGPPLTLKKQFNIDVSHDQREERTAEMNSYRESLRKP